MNLIENNQPLTQKDRQWRAVLTGRYNAGNPSYVTDKNDFTYKDIKKLFNRLNNVRVFSTDNDKGVAYIDQQGTLSVKGKLVYTVDNTKRLFHHNEHLPGLAYVSHSLKYPNVKLLHDGTNLSLPQGIMIEGFNLDEWVRNTPYLTKRDDVKSIISSYSSIGNGYLYKLHGRYTGILNIKYPELFKMGSEEWVDEIQKPTYLRGHPKVPNHIDTFRPVGVSICGFRIKSDGMVYEPQVFKNGKQYTVSGWWDIEKSYTQLDRDESVVVSKYLPEGSEGTPTVSFLSYNDDIFITVDGATIDTNLFKMFPSSGNIVHVHDGPVYSCSDDVETLKNHPTTEMCLARRWRAHSNFYPNTWRNRTGRGTINFEIVNPDGVEPITLDTYPKLVKPMVFDANGYCQCASYNHDALADKIFLHRNYVDPVQHVHLLAPEMWVDSVTSDTSNSGINNDIRIDRGMRHYSTSCHPANTRPDLLDTLDLSIHFTKPSENLCDFNPGMGFNGFIQNSYRASDERNPPTGMCGVLGILPIPYNEGRIVKGEVIGDVMCAVFDTSVILNSTNYTNFVKFYKLPEGRDVLTYRIHPRSGMAYYVVDETKVNIKKLTYLKMSIKELREFLRHVVPRAAINNDGFTTIDNRKARLFYQPDVIETRLIAYGDNTRFHWDGNKCPVCVQRGSIFQNFNTRIYNVVRIEMGKHGYYGVDDGRVTTQYFKVNGPEINITPLPTEEERNRVRAERDVKYARAYRNYPQLLVTVEECERELYGRKFQVIPCTSAVIVN